MIDRQLLNEFSKNLPICSVDLICKYKSKFLLVKRNNHPAKNKLCFVGGIVQKKQSIFQNIKRIAKRELSISLKKNQIKFLNYQRFIFKKNFNGKNVDTDYVSLLHSIELSRSDVDRINLNGDNSLFVIISKKEIINNKNVLNYVKKIFKN